MKKQRKRGSFLAYLSSKNVAYVCLVGIFGVLLMQSALSLFIGGPLSAELTQIDVVFRTAISSIFGYMMSIVSTASSRSQEGARKQAEQKSKTVGFSPPPAGSSEPTEFRMQAADEAQSGGAPRLLPTPPPAVQRLKKRKMLNIHIVVLSVICIFCLFVMLFVRYASHMVGNNSAALFTLSMYRSIVSGSIGALIGLARAGSQEAPPPSDDEGDAG